MKVCRENELLPAPLGVEKATVARGERGRAGLARARRPRLAVFAAAAAMTLSGCAEERAPINRVQPNALAKSFFVGDLASAADDPEFYMRTSVIDVSAGAGSDGLFTSSDAEPTTRVRFEITEDLLIARLTYALVEDAEYRGAKRTPDGQIVAAYEIQSHFDIRRDYDQATGEESNVIVENDSDRAWNEREYFRVDWSRNLVTDAYELDALSQLGIYYGVVWDPVAYYVNDPDSPDAPVFDPERGYFDVTNKAYASPQVIEDPEWGDFPACWLYGQWPMVNCNPSEVTLRQAFLRVTDTDYEPVDYDGTKMDMFGYFTNDRFGYDRRHGVTDTRWHRFASRWNLYERSHAEPAVVCATAETTPIGADVHRDDDGNGTEDECEAVGRGSRCDEFTAECTIPLRDRAVKTIPWYVNEGSPEELFEGSSQALDAWSEAMRVAIVAGRLAECRRTGESGCEAQMGWPSPWSDTFSPAVGAASPAEVPRVFVLCHNPVAQDDDAACGARGTIARQGDLRYSLINLIQEPQYMSPWGISMDAEDPLTGEKIVGSSNQWGAVLDRAAGTLVDLVRLINGQSAPDEFITGQTIDDWVAANRAGGSSERSMAMSAGEIASRKAAFDPAVLAPYNAGKPAGENKPLPAPLRHKARAQALIDAGQLGPGNAELSARLKALRGTSIEAAMVSPDMAQAAGFDPTGPISAEAVRRASPFGLMSPAARRSQERAQKLGRAKRHACRVEEPEPEYLLGLAQEAAALFGTPDPNDPAAVLEHEQKLFLWARQSYSRGVMAHELGHSMGLRHNFAASFDSLNYGLPYWQLRTNNGSLTEECAEGTTDGSSCVGPRWKDPLTDAEREGNINKHATTSVMDYPGDQNQDMALPGSYDRAAIRFGYGGVVDVWTEDGVSVDGSGAGQKKAYKLSAFAVSPGLFGVYYFPDPVEADAFIHYSQYQKEFGLLGECSADSSPDAVFGQRCTGAPMDVVDYRDMRDWTAYPDFASFSWAITPRAADPAGRVRRGYMFSSDEYSDSGNVPSFTDDAGADAYEQIRFLESSYENRYILDAFRRDRVMFTSEDAVARIQARYLDPIQLIAKTFAFAAILDGDPAAPTDELFADGYYGPLGFGASVAMDLFGRILTRPEPGYYCPADNPDCYGTAQPYGVDTILYTAEPGATPDLFPDFYDFRLGLTEGRYVHNDFDYSQGYWWGDYQTQVGAYYEKIWATYYLSEAFDSFIGNSKEDFTDGRYKNVNFMTVYPEQVRRLYASLLTGDAESYAPWVIAPTNDGTPHDGEVFYPAWHSTTWAPRPDAGYPVDPNWSWNEQLYAMVWSTMFFPTNWSQSWVNDARIAVLASDQPGWPASETYTFYDPASGMTYRAHAVGTENVMGKTHQRGVGARMLEWANKLVTVAYEVETAGGEVVLNDDGTPKLVLDGSGKPIKNAANPGAGGVLQKYVDNLDIFRQLTATFEQPLTDDDLPQP
jgi:hypothetical protein